MLARFSALILCLTLFGCVSPSQPDRVDITAQTVAPNIIFILVDDLGWGDVGYHGSEIATPNLDALAASGVELDRAYAFPICSPTRAALMTGRNPLQYGIDGPMENDAQLPAELTLMPEYLRDAGYETWLVGKWHLGMGKISAMPHSRGFDSFYGFLGGFVDYYTHVYFGGLDWQRNGASVREEGYASDLLTDEAVRLIEADTDDKPFFMYLSLISPHTPLQYPPNAERSYNEIADPDRRVFAQMVSDMDSDVGRVMDALQARGIADNTIVVFMSDNGGNTEAGASNGALRGGKGSPLEGGVRVPAFVVWPGTLAAAKITDSPLFVQDWLPTLLDAAGVDYNSSAFDGISRWRALSGVADDSAAAAPIIVGTARAKAVYAWPFKLVRLERQAADSLYNVLDDPFEERDIAASNPALLARLGAMLDALPVVPSSAATGPPPESLFRDADGAFIHDIRKPETREPWAEAAARD